MQVASERMLLQKLGRNLLAFGAIAVLIGGAANAQNFDQGKSVTRLFADNCATCHRSARGLAKGRFSLTPFLFLQKHYTSNSGSAWALTSYLESVDSAQPRPPRRSRRWLGQGRCRFLSWHKLHWAPPKGGKSLLSAGCGAMSKPSPH